MNPKSLLIAVGILAVLGGAVYYTRENPPPAGEENPKITDVDEEQIQALTVERAGKEPIAVERGEDDQWRFAEPLAIRADSSSIGFMAESAASLEAERVVEENVTDWGQYGLENPELTVELELDGGESHKVLFGRETPTGSAVYARLAGDPRLFTVLNYSKTGFEKEIFDLRDKKLLNVDPDKVSRVSLTRDGNTLEFGKSGEANWQILKPRPLRADNFAVGDLARAVQNAAMTAVAGEGEEEIAKYDFSNPYAVAEVVDEAGAHTLTLISADDKYYAQSSDLDGVYEVASTTAESLDKTLDDLRNKKLFDFGFSDPAKLQIRDADTRLTIEKMDENWLLTSEGDRELDSHEVQTLIDSLRNLTASSFVSDNAAERRKFGLETPAIEAEVTQADGATTEKVVITSPSAQPVYAAREGQPTTYEVETTAVEDIRTAVEGLLREEKPATKDAATKE